MSSGVGVPGARAELTIEITQGVDNPTAIAVVPFAWQGAGTPPEDIAAVVDGDLTRSGQFAPVGGPICWACPVPRRRCFTATGGPSNRVPGDRAGLGGRSDAHRIRAVRCAAPDQSARGRGDRPGQRGAHAGAPGRDAVYEKLTGIPGAFATRLLYVSVTRVPGGKDYFRLTLADSDGARPIVLLESREPVLAPTWSPDGKQIAYVSFETSRPAIYRQELATGRASS